MLVYYAHCKAIYDTPQEQRDIKILQRLGFTVLNPNEFKHKANWESKGMEYADFLVGSSDAVAFRALPGGSIPAGVSKEIHIAERLGLPVIELPNFSLRETMSIEHTRAYLAEVGER